jgi:DMSO/TMAO reductase YedYZ molybdopterin-dependent catalytic subunit
MDRILNADSTHALNRAAASHEALHAGLTIRRPHPLNCEISIPALIGGVVMPTARFYVRNHFPMPSLDPAAFRLKVGGLVERRLSLGIDDLEDMRSQTRIVTLECAGNGRSLFVPPIAGERWDLGAVSTAEWTGVPLMEVLHRAGLQAGAREVVFRGADRGKVEGRLEPIRFERSLKLEQLREAQPLLAYAMNGEPLPKPHGYPLRLVVPGWYAVASVKWLTEIELVDHPFMGYFQQDKYRYEWEREGGVVREPVELQRVRALIVKPAPGQEVRCGDVAIRGVAWSGTGTIVRVEIDAGDGWIEAHLCGKANRHCWQRWELISKFETPMPVTLRARATDSAGCTQPARTQWNRLGYGNNAIHQVQIRVRN